MTRYETVIGLEVHVQLGTDTKMFCRCEARFGAPPNTLVCPICSGQPGTLPSLNAEALRRGVLAGLALGCSIDPTTKFDRKNYFYPDLPKGYQISQFDRPLCRDGHFSFDRADGSVGSVTIVRAHLEEDSGKIIHPQGMDISLVDLNRAGMALLEIVTGPDLHSPEDAMAYLKDLRQTLRYAGVSECDMEKGSFRCDANISLRPEGTETLGTRTEIKNLNSFRFVAGALQAEIDRQGAVLEAGGTITQMTMGFDPDTGKTTALRTKEEAHDYRYFPEPDLPWFDVDPAWVEQLRGELPESPVDRQQRYVRELGLKTSDAEELVAEKTVADYFEALLDHDVPGPDAARWILNDVKGLANDRHRPLYELAVTPERLAALMHLVLDGTLSAQAGRAIVVAMEEQPHLSATDLAHDMDLAQVSDTAVLEQLVADVIASETELVDRYREGKTGVLNALLGSAMKASKGKANPNAVKDLLERALS